MPDKFSTLERKLKTYACSIAANSQFPPELLTSVDGIAEGFVKHFRTAGWPMLPRMRSRGETPYSEDDLFADLAGPLREVITMMGKMLRMVRGE